MIAGYIALGLVILLYILIGVGGYLLYKAVKPYLALASIGKPNGPLVARDTVRDVRSILEKHASLKS